MLAALLAPSLLAAMGPLRVHPQNGRYFATPDGRALLLGGSHTWETVQDMTTPSAQGLFDFDAFLDLCATNGHNFIRLWHWEHPYGAGWSREPISFAPMPFARTGPGLAADGQPRFDLDRFDERYFNHLRQRILQARSRGFYVSVMLFQGFSLKKLSGQGLDPFDSHPFNASNNINGLTVLSSTEDKPDRPTLHNLGNPRALRYQEAYVRKVVDTVNDLDNVLYEIINEGGTVPWHQHFIRFIKDYQRTKPQQHPVGFTHTIVPQISNHDLFASEADWISPANEPFAEPYPGSVLLHDYKNDPPANDGRKVVLLDTDHLWGHGGNALWAWKAVCRGHNPLFMDPWEPVPGAITREEAPWFWDAQGRDMNTRDYPLWPPLRAALGDARRLTQRMNLARATPRNDLASTRYCLADPGQTYLILAPDGGKITLDLCGAKGPFTLEWWSIPERVTTPGPSIKGGDYFVLAPPFHGPTVAFLHLQP